MYAAVLTRSGSGRYRDANGFERRLHPGDLIIVFPELPHQYGPDPGDVWDELFIVFEGPIFDHWRAYGLDPAHPVWNVGNPGARVAEFERLLASDTSSFGAACSAVAALHRSLADWIDHRTPETGVPRWLARARERLSTFNAKIPLAAVAKEAGLSVDAFRDAFQKATGENPSTFRSRQRLSQATSMLHRQELKLAEIAETLGFTDAFHLSKAFKAGLGFSPSEYRARIRHSNGSTPANGLQG